MSFLRASSLALTTMSAISLGACDQQAEPASGAMEPTLEENLEATALTEEIDGSVAPNGADAATLEEGQALSSDAQALRSSLRSAEPVDGGPSATTPPAEPAAEAPTATPADPHSGHDMTDQDTVGM